MSGELAHTAFEGFVRWSIERELPNAPAFLAGEELAGFQAYYRTLPRPADSEEIRAYVRGLWRGEVGFTARWIAAAVARLERPPRVLDAGCGHGTFSLLFAAMGADVVGADLRPDRLAVAERRSARYAADTGRALAVRFERRDLASDWQASFDLVWVHNALSHIDPLEPFLDRVATHLAPGGVFVVGDINGANPQHRRRLNALRGEVHQEYVAPDGHRYAYAVERPFAPRELRQLAEARGLIVVRHELYWFGLASAPDWLHAGVLAPLQSHAGLGAHWARRQLFVAQQPATAGAGRPGR